MLLSLVLPNRADKCIKIKTNYCREFTRTHHAYRHISLAGHVNTTPFQTITFSTWNYRSIFCWENGAEFCSVHSSTFSHLILYTSRDLDSSSRFHTPESDTIRSGGEEKWERSRETKTGDDQSQQQKKKRQLSDAAACSTSSIVIES